MIDRLFMAGVILMLGSMLYLAFSSVFVAVNAANLAAHQDAVIEVEH